MVVCHWAVVKRWLAGACVLRQGQPLGPRRVFADYRYVGGQNQRHKAPRIRRRERRHMRPSIFCTDSTSSLARRICQANPALEPTCVKCPRNTGDPSSPAQLRSWGLTLRPVRTGVASGSPCQASPSSCAPPAPHFRRRTHTAPRRRSLIPPTRRRSGEWRPAG